MRVPENIREHEKSFNPYHFDLVETIHLPDGVYCL
jgi:hypothetical protein